MYQVWHLHRLAEGTIRPFAQRPLLLFKTLFYRLLMRCQIMLSITSIAASLMIASFFEAATLFKSLGLTEHYQPARILILSVLWLTYFFFCSDLLLPKDLARIRMDTSQEPRLLFVASDSIIKICYEALGSVAPIRSNIDRMLSLLHEREPYQELGAENQLQLLVELRDESFFFEKSMARLQYLHRKQKKRLQRIDREEAILSERIGIPLRSTGDHILRFSAELYSEELLELRKLLQLVLSRLKQDWRERHLGADLSDTFTYLDRQLHRIDTIITEAERIAGHQKENLSNIDLGQEIFEIVGAGSASRALLRFTESLTNIRLPSFYTSLPTKRLQVRMLTQATQKIRFVSRKQKAYPGVSPYLQLKNLAKHKQSMQSTVDLLEKLAGSPLDELTALSEKDLTAIQKLSFETDYFIYESRRKIAEEFKHRYIKWKSEKVAPRGRHFIVCHGSSATTQNIIGWTVDEPNVPNLIVCFSDSSDIKMISSRRIVYGLRASFRSASSHPLESAEHTRSSKPSAKARHRFAIINVRSFLNMLTPDDRVLLLLGAEAFDEQGRIVYSRGLSSFEKKLRAEIEPKELPEGKCPSRYLVAVLAESYKKHPDLVEKIGFGDLIDTTVDIINLASQPETTILTCSGTHENWSDSKSTGQ